MAPYVTLPTANSSLKGDKGNGKGKGGPKEQAGGGYGGGGYGGGGKYGGGKGGKGSKGGKMSSLDSALWGNSWTGDGWSGGSSNDDWNWNAIRYLGSFAEANPFDALEDSNEDESEAPPTIRADSHFNFQY